MTLTYTQIFNMLNLLSSLETLKKEDLIQAILEIAQQSKTDCQLYYAWD